MKLFEFILEKKMIAIGLLRKHDVPQPYVFTNPPPNTILFPDDSVFVLSTKEPSPDLPDLDLQDDPPAKKSPQETLVSLEGDTPSAASGVTDPVL